MITMPTNKGSHENSQAEDNFWGILVTLFHCFLSLSVCSSFTLCLRRTCCVWSTLSTAFVANGTCCSLAGYGSDNSIVSVYCPPCLPCTHPCVALYTIIQLGIPSRPAFKNNINYRTCPLCVMTCEVYVYF